MDAGLEAVSPSGWDDEKRMAGWRAGDPFAHVLVGRVGVVLGSDRAHDTRPSGKVSCSACSSPPTLSAAECDGAPCQTGPSWRLADDSAGAVRGLAPLPVCHRRLIARLSMQGTNATAHASAASATSAT